MAAYLELAAHLAYDLFSLYKYLVVNLVLSPPRFLEWKFLSDCTFPDHYLFFFFFIHI